MFFNVHVKNLKSYSVSSHKAWECEATDAIKLDWNEAAVPPSPLVRQALIDFATSGQLHWYPDVDNKLLRTKLANYCEVPLANVDYYASSDALHEYVIRAFINPGDSVVIVGPTYDNFRAAAESIGAVVNYCYLDQETDFIFDYERFESDIEKYTPKIVYLCNPNNPTGTIFSIEQIEHLIRRFNDVFFIIDEAYYEFTGITSAKLCVSYENIIVTRTFSKAFALASVRVGYAVSSVHNINGLHKIRNPKNISSFAQVAALAALNDWAYTKSYVDAVHAAKHDFIGFLRGLGMSVYGSRGGNFVLVDLGVDRDHIVNELESENIFIRRYGHVQRMENFTRITIGTSEQMKVLKDCLVGLKGDS